MFQKFKDDIKGTWKTIKPNERGISLVFFKDGENILYDKRVITKKFNRYYANVGFNLSENNKIPSNKTFQNYLKHKNNNNFQFKNINEEIVLCIIVHLAPKTS